MNEKGIYVSLTEYIKGPVYEVLQKVIEEETLNWIQSSEGRAIIKRTAIEIIEREIQGEMRFGYYGDHREKVFKKIVAEAVWKEMFRAVGHEMPPSPDKKDGT